MISHLIKRAIWLLFRRSYLKLKWWLQPLFLQNTHTSIWMQCFIYIFRNVLNVWTLSLNSWLRIQALKIIQIKKFFPYSFGRNREGGDSGNRYWGSRGPLVTLKMNFWYTRTLINRIKTSTYVYIAKKIELFWWPILIELIQITYLLFRCRDEAGYGPIRIGRYHTEDMKEAYAHLALDPFSL